MNHDDPANEHTRLPPAGALKDPDAYIELTLGEALHARIWINGRANEVIGQILALADPGRNAPAPRRTGLAPQLLPLIEAGLLRPGQELAWHRPRLRRTDTVTVTADGRLRIADGTAWPSPFQAALRLGGYPADGWVRFKTADGRSLKDLKTSLENPEPDPTEPAP